jgi:hypothetical protein
MKYGFIKKEIKGEKVLASFNFRIGDEKKSERQISDWRCNGTAIEKLEQKNIPKSSLKINWTR